MMCRSLPCNDMNQLKCLYKPSLSILPLTHSPSPPARSFRSSRLNTPCLHSGFPLPSLHMLIDAFQLLSVPLTISLPAVATSLISTSVSLFAPCKQVPPFQIPYVCVHIGYFSLFDSLYSVQETLGSSTSVQLAQIYSFLWLSRGFLGGQQVKNLPATQETQVQFLGRSPGRGHGKSVVFLPGESHGWGSLVGYSPWGWKEQDTTEAKSQHSSKHISPKENFTDQKQVYRVCKSPCDFIYMTIPLHCVLTTFLSTVGCLLDHYL